MHKSFEIVLLMQALQQRLTDFIIVNDFLQVVLGILEPILLPVCLDNVRFGDVAQEVHGLVVGQLDQLFLVHVKYCQHESKEFPPSPYYESFPQ